MRRDKGVDRRILLAIEAKRSRAAAPVDVDGVDPQDALDHLASMHEEGLYSGPKPHKSSRSGEIDQVLVSDLTPAGRQRLKQLNDEHQRNMVGGTVTFAEALEHAPESNAVGLRGVQADGAAGEIRPAISNDVPPGGVVIAGPGSERRSTPTRIPAVVILQVDALLLLLRSEADRLRQLRINDNPDLRELEELEQKLDEVRNTTVAVESGRVPPDAAEQAARSLGNYVRSWFDKNHEKILTDVFDGTFKVGVFVSATAICASLMHVEPNLAATISGVLVGGAPVTDSIKVVSDWWNNLKDNNGD
ncbi:hypothetical protein HAP48_0037570 [Bradyrhizobium septentrionale]|uniref:Uncharacterized protein n=1 Tax=Bradyrhizobium septentrionale TaxID=1404411 RepID=A0A973W0X9_9BRAD|nr:hypothetical protein [Bradyrhizobium septentrionale]UGY14227.1 hypothetical protein HAP48_0037570 [Bradyrhizobium septentrionale]